MRYLGPKQLYLKRLFKTLARTDIFCLKPGVRVLSVWDKEGTVTRIQNVGGLWDVYVTWDGQRGENKIYPETEEFVWVLNT